MAFDVGIKITANADLAGTRAAAQGIDDVKKSAVAANTDVRQVAKTAAAGAIGMLDLGRAGNAAANALQAVLTGAGPMAIAMAAVGATIAFVSSQIDKQREKLRELAERELAAIQQATENIKFDQGIRQQIAALKALDPELEAVRQKYDLLAIAAKNADEETRGRIEIARELERKKVLDARVQEKIKEQEAIVARITSAKAETAAFGQTGSALIALTTAQKINAIQTDEQLKKHAALTQHLISEIDALGRLQQAQNLISTGGGALTDFQNQFGVTFDIERKRVGSQLADQFGVVFNQLKSDPGAQAQLSGAFNSFVTQAVQLGVPDIGELIASKIGSANFERLRSALGDDLRAQLEASAQAGQQWGVTFEDEMRRYLANAANVGVATDQIAQKWNALQQQFTNELAVNIDVSQPLAAVDQVRARINAIPDVTRKQVILDVLYAASPARPFSEFLPFMSKTFGNLNDIVANATPEVILKVPDLPGSLRQIADLQAKISEASSFGVRQPGYFGGTPFGPRSTVFYSQTAKDNYLSGLQAQIEDLQFRTAAGISQASAVGGGGGGAGGAGVIVNIDLRESTMSRAFLDDELIPALERGIIRATGQDPQLRVLN